MSTMPETRSPDGSVVVKWDDSQMKTSYANVAHVTTSREEAVLVFGVNKTWMKSPEMTIQMSERIIMTPHAAKRLFMMLATALHEHEARHGPLQVDASPPGAAGPR